MTIGDLSHLGGARGSVREQASPIARAKVVRAPATKNDGLAVRLEGYAAAFPIDIPAGHWTQRGTLLPAVGAICCVVNDGKDDWLVGYEGTVP